jgi:hypothetical protein
MNCFFSFPRAGAERFCVWYKFYVFLRIDKFQGKTFGEFYYGNCLTQLTYTTSYMCYVQFYV